MMKSEILSNLSVARVSDAPAASTTGAPADGAAFGRTLDTWRGHLAAQGVRADRQSTRDAAQTSAAEPAPRTSTESASPARGTAAPTASRDARRMDERAQQTRREASARAERAASTARAEGRKDAATDAASEQAAPNAQTAAPDGSDGTTSTVGEATAAVAEQDARPAPQPDALATIVPIDPRVLATQATVVAAPQAMATPLSGTVPGAADAPAPGAHTRHAAPRTAPAAEGGSRTAGVDGKLAATAQDSAPVASASSQDVSTRDFAAMLSREVRRHEGGGEAVQAGLPTTALAGTHAPVAGTPSQAAAPAVPDDYAVAAPLGSDGFSAGFTESVSLVMADGLETAEIQLNPPDMGPVRIELSLDGKDARLVFTAAQPDTRLAIEQSAPLLKSMLSEQGLNLSGFDIGAGRQSDQRAQDGRAQSDGRGNGRGGQPGSTAGIDGQTGGAPRASVRARGLLDLFA